MVTTRCNTLVSACMLFLSLVGTVNCLRHHLAIHNDDRTIFKIETFGFVADGKMRVKISDFSLHFSTKEMNDYKQVVSTSNNSHALGSEITVTKNPSDAHRIDPSRANSALLANPPSNVRRFLQTVNKTNTSAPAKLPPVTAPSAAQPPVSPISVPESVHTVSSMSPKNASVSTVHPTGKANSTHSKSAGENKPPFYLVGFLLRHASSESGAQADVERIVEKRQCILEHIHPYDVFIDMSDPETWTEKIELTHFVSEESIGLYSLIFARCYPAGTHYASFKLEATFHNPGPNYLSAGDTPLPSMYFAFFVAFTLALFVWVWVLRRDTATNGRVHYIHYMMLILLVLKCLSLFFEGVRYHYISLYGVSEMWSVVYYVFAFLKGVMLFTVILLIGSGWSLMKSYLNDKEKRIVWVVLVLQVLDNIAMIVLEESAPGSQGWLTWRDILHLVDIVCCCAILLPIVWSIRHLRQAAEVDGKAHNSLQKLQLFRQFYVMVVIYVYFTRIVVYILTSTVPFYLLWLGPLSTEIATFLFFTVTGYKFRPAPDNPYLPVSSEDQEGAEYGLEEGEQHGVQLQAPPSRGKK